jgi:hypothetical protein
MKPFWQQQQQQMQKQQQQMRRRQMEGAYWQQQQKEKAKREQAAAHREDSDRFAQVEAEVARLRGELASGELSADQFKAQLQELMVQDATGKWWMIGYETNQWYVHDGANWVRADPPGYAPQRSPVPTMPQSMSPPKPKTSRLQGCTTFVTGLILTAAAGFFAGDWSYNNVSGFGNTESLILASAVWLIGLAATVYYARRAWRGD